MAVLVSNMNQSNLVSDLFQAIEVTYRVEWSKPEVVVIPDDNEVDVAVIRPTKSPSTNTFAVPDDDEESGDELPSLESDNESDEEHAENPSDDSKYSDPRSWDSIVLQPTEKSSVSSAERGEAQEPKSGVDLGPQKAFVPVPFISAGEIACDTLSPLGPSCEDLVKSLPSEHAEPHQPEIDSVNPMLTQGPISSIAEKTDAIFPFSAATLSSSKQTDKFPETCYQKVPEDSFNKWTMMRPMFMRLADLAWGESDHIPDVDYEQRVIHAARRCSLAQGSYMIEDSPDFKPRVGTEVNWMVDPIESDTSFHRLPGQSLRYWSIDKRRYWIIKDEESQDTSNWWWIVEKPWGMLSDAVKEQLVTETEIDDCHKCWIVRAWEPQLIGDTWWETAPYWSSTFDQELLSDDESVDSDENWGGQ